MDKKPAKSVLDSPIPPGGMVRSGGKLVPRYARDMHPDEPIRPMRDKGRGLEVEPDKAGSNFTDRLESDFRTLDDRQRFGQASMNAAERAGNEADRQRVGKAFMKQAARDSRVGAGRGEVNPKPVGYKAGGMVRRGYGKARGA